MPLAWKFRKSAAEPAPELGALMPKYVPPLALVLAALLTKRFPNCNKPDIVVPAVVV